MNAAIDGRGERGKGENGPFGRVLVTGAARGLGRYLHLETGGEGLTRANAEEVLGWAVAGAGFDVILHCAFPSAKRVSERDMASYVQDSVLLTRRLLGVKHGVFVFVSSVDVYPAGEGLRREEDEIEAAAGISPYGLAKLMCEALVKEVAPRWLILRPVQLLGSHGRPNSVTRILEGDRAVLSLTEDSEVNCILHADVLAFLRSALRGGLEGVYNLAASANATLGEIAAAHTKEPEWGAHRYEIGEISNAKAAGILEIFRRSTIENVARHWAALQMSKLG